MWKSSSHVAAKPPSAVVYLEDEVLWKTPMVAFAAANLKRLFCLVGEGTESGGLGWSRRYNVEETGLVLRSHGISGFADQGSVIRLGTGNEGGHRSSGALRHQNVRGLEEKHLVGVHGTEIWL